MAPQLFLVLYQEKADRNLFGNLYGNQYKA